MSIERPAKCTCDKYVTAADAGKALHPLHCEGQDEGSAMMGFGHTFYETYHFDAGQMINSSMVDYKVPGFDDVPDQFESILIEDANGPGPYGAKGLGEGGIIPVAPAIANAIAWCTGARIKSSAVDAGESVACDQTGTGKIIITSIKRNASRVLVSQKNQVFTSATKASFRSKKF